MRDRGLLLADGLFETLLWRGGLVDFDGHAARLARGCAVIGLPAPPAAELERAAASAVRTAGLERERAAVRLTWTAGEGGRGLDRPGAVSPILYASADRASAPPGPARLVTVAVRRNERSPLSRLKSLAYLDNVLARRAARKAGADAALMINTRGEIACADAANLFWFDGDHLVTPALACGVLDGVVRGRVLAAALELGIPVREARARRRDLNGARGVFLTNSLMGLRPVAELDGAKFGSDPRVARLAEAYPT